MPGKLFWIMFLTASLLIFSSNSSAEMASENYRIRSTVTSAGGVPAGSANYQLNGTIGQPSPLMDSLDPPFSDSYDLYPGFWYTVIGPKCVGDYEGDGDVDGSDLAAYVAGDLSIRLEEFAQDFGRVNCY